MKFKVGDSARLKYVRSDNNINWKAGIIVTIVRVKSDISSLGTTYDYLVSFDHSIQVGFVLEEQLEPIIEDKSSWESIEEMLGWNPSKETVNAL